MKLNDLVGFQLVNINRTEIIVEKDDVTYKLAIKGDSGDCCGYNDIDTTLLISEDELSRNPVITNIELEDSDGYSESKCKVTFYGEYKPMAVIDSLSSSGSGWCYGACVTSECKALDLDCTITAW